MRMVRRPLQSLFDSNLLRSWLGTDETVTSNAGRLSKSFQYLLDKERLRLIDVATGQLIVAREPTRYVALSYVWGHSMNLYSANTLGRTS